MGNDGSTNSPMQVEVPVGGSSSARTAPKHRLSEKTTAGPDGKHRRIEHINNVDQEQLDQMTNDETLEWTYDE